MADYTEYLDRIAAALEAAAQAPDPTSISPWTALILGAVLGALGRYFVWEYQQRRILNSKRLLFSGLIGDEIYYRWRPYIGKDLTDIFKDDFDLQTFRKFCNTMKISDDDLPVCKMAHDNALGLDSVLRRRFLVSHIVHVYVRLRDLCDAQTMLRVLLSEYDDEEEVSRRNELERRMKGHWERLRQLVDVINSETGLIFEAIRQDYGKFTRERKEVCA